MAVLTPAPLFIRSVGYFTALLGLLVLLGWLFDISLLKSILPGAVEMKANTAVAFVLTAIALLAINRPLGAVSKPLLIVPSIAIAAIGLATLGEYLFGWQLGIDQLLFLDRAKAYNAIPGRMSPYSTVAFAAMGIAFSMTLRRELRWLVVLLAMFVEGIGMSGLLGYLWNATELITDRVLPPVALHTAIAFTLLGLAIPLATQILHRRAGADALHVSIELKVAGGFLAAFFLLILGGGLNYRTSDEFARSMQWVAHTEEVRQQLSQLDAAIAHAEAAQMNYLFTDDARHQTHFSTFAAEARAHIATLLQLTEDNPPQQQLLLRLSALLDRRLLGLQQTVAVFAEKHDLQIERNLSGDAELVESIRALMRQLERNEDVLLSERVQKTAISRSHQLIFLLATLLGMGALFAVFLHNIRREMLARAKVEADILRLNTDLELRVKERTAELEENRQRFVDLFEYAPDALVMTDRSGIILQVNRQTEAIFGWPREELHGQPVEMLMPVAAHETHRQLRQRYLEAAMPRSMGAGRPNLRALHRDGRVFPVDISLSPLQTTDGLAVVAAVRDTTEIRNAEEKIRAINADLERRVEQRTSELVQARRDAEDANKAKSAFLATMSHEIRTPMNAIIGLTYLLQHSEGRENMEAVEMITGASKHLLAIIDSILDLSKIEAGQLHLEDRDFDLHVLTANIVSMLSAQAQAKGIQLKTESSPLPRYVRGDVTRVTQAFLNLASNAVKFTEHGSVTLRMEKITDTDEKIWIRFEVIDTGIGIPSDVLPKLFTRFQQADNSTTRNFGGTGLGLAITRGLAELMGGAAGVESEPGHGSKFWFSACLKKSQSEDPLGETEQFADGAAAMIAREFSGARLLLAEDNVINQKVAQLLLERVGLNIDIANDGAEVIDYLRRHGAAHYALVLMDVQMPQVDGFEATKQLRNLSMTLPVLAMTANAFSEDRARCLAAGMNDFVAKPIQPTQLYSTLLRWLRHGRSASSQQ